MPAPAGVLTDTVLQRVYDAGAVATTRAQIWTLLSYCQQIVNQAMESVLVTATFPTGPRQQVFMLADFSTDIMDVKSVRDQNRDLSQIPFNRLKHISTHWFGASGPRWETFAKLGRTMIVVHPMMQLPSQITLVYTRILPVLGGDNDVCLLANDELRLLTKLVETLVLLRQRNFGAVKLIIDQFVKEAQATKAATGHDGHLQMD